ncbi:MAG: OmpH family outer membrane protein [candidate division KSB1 bacterium]|nr:OmpH family outer membrane protein [candidate division KSB1 bacterium]MDZ7334454.1 OmpH family outer membrane protein [candidate division KSB1 bacterium]MDZ7355981.1 OmpH family outer membrane protein [candidate division KSB1 bacterium]MDZ7400685.1 OmpH family outer membrane protein [candidate division KSB1 bacterium]
MLLRNLTKMMLALGLMALMVTPGFSQKMKIGIVHSQKVIAELKEWQDAQKKLDEVIRQWENEGQEMLQKLQQMREQFDAQSLLLSETKKKEKQQELEALSMQLQKFQREKFDPQSGEVVRKQAELIQPVLDKINAVIKKIGDEEKFDYIFDTNNGAILYFGSDQPDLTDRVLAELNKGQSVKTEPTKGKDNR